MRFPDSYVIAVDLDNTLAEYDHWRGQDHIGKLIEPTRYLLQQLRIYGWKIILFTCRTNGMNGETPAEQEGIIKFLESWMNDNEVPFDYIARKEDGKVFAHVYLDDRAVRWLVKQNADWGYKSAMLTMSELLFMHDKASWRRDQSNPVHDRLRTKGGQLYASR